MAQTATRLPIKTESKGAAAPSLLPEWRPFESLRREIDQHPMEEVDACEGRRHLAAFLVDVVAARRHVGIDAQQRERARRRGHVGPREVRIAILRERDVAGGVDAAECELGGDESAIGECRGDELHAARQCGGYVLSQ